MACRIIKIILICLFSSVLLYSQSLNFQKEKIEITVCEYYCTVTGTYYFENAGLFSTKNIIYYPFIINETLPFPDSICVFDLRNNTSVEFKTTSRGILFNILVPPNSVLSCRVFYRQKTPRQKMEYILTSTKAWKNKLSSAEFEIVIPKNFLLKFLSYKEDKIKETCNNVLYYFSKNNFMPDHNLVLKWSRKGG